MSIEGLERSDSEVFPAVFETADGLTLKQLTEEDVEAYHQLIDFDRDHLRQFGDNTGDKYPDAESIKESIVNPKRAGRIRYGVWIGGNMVARVSIESISGNTAEVGYLVGKKYIGHGYAAKALRPLCDYVFANNMFNELEAHIAVGNHASRKTIENCGFKETEVRRLIDQSGNERDFWIFNLSSK